MTGESSDDFVIHTTTPNNERKIRAARFITDFKDGFTEGTSRNPKGFDLIDRGQRQPDGVSCYFASLVASARGMGTTKEAFQSTVKSLVSRARQMGIVNEWGLAQTYTTQIAELCNQVGIDPEFVTYFPNDMSSTQAKELGKRIASALNEGYGIALLIPSRHHYILLHNGRSMTRLGFDPLTGQEQQQSIDIIGSVMANIVSGEMQGERFTRNGFVILKPKHANEPDFVINSVR